MFDAIPQMPSYLDIKGENQNIFQINLDNSENSTRESHPECDTSKFCEDASELNKSEDLFLEQQKRRFILRTKII